MSNRFRVKVAIPAIDPAEVGEVVKRTLKRAINGGEPTSEDIGLQQPEFVFEALQGDSIHLELTHTDDADNVSEASVFDLVVSDTIPPARPGQLSATVEEIPDEPPQT